MVFSAMGKDFPWSNRPASHLGNLQLTLACLQCARRPVSPCTVTQWRWWTSSMVWKKYDGMCRSSVGHTEWPYYEVCRLIYGSSILANPPGASPVAPSMSSLSLTVLSNPADEVEIDAMTEWERGKEKKKKSHNNALILVWHYFRSPKPKSYEHDAVFSETHLTRLHFSSH